MVEVEAILCCETKDEGTDERGSEDGSACCEDVAAIGKVDEVDARLRVTVSEAGLSAAEL